MVWSLCLDCLIVWGGACINIYGSWCTYACLHTWMCVYVSECVYLRGVWAVPPGLGIPTYSSTSLCSPGHMSIKNHFTETSLAIQSLTLHASNTGGAGSIPWLGELGSCMLFGAAQKMKKKTKPKNNIHFTVCMPWVVYIRAQYTKCRLEASLPSCITVTVPWRTQDSLLRKPKWNLLLSCFICHWNLSASSFKCFGTLDKPS